MSIEKSDEELASEYDDLAYKALANPDLSEGLANQIARVAKNTASALRHGGAREGAGRPPNGRKRFVAYVTDEEREKLLSAVPRLRPQS